MPELGYSQENKQTTVFDMDQLRLKKGEHARIALLDTKAKVQLCHWVKDPNAGEGDRKGRYVVCLGDYATVMKDGADVQRCPACRVGEPVRDAMVSVARRRFVTHIARYRTNAKGQVLSPISIALQAWVFSDDKYNMLADRAAEHGDLRKHDLNLSCVTETYQKYDIDVSPKLMLASDAGAVGQYKQLLAERSNEIERLLGNPMKYEALSDLLEKATPVIKEEEIASEAESAVAEVMADLETEVPTAEEPGSVETEVTEESSVEEAPPPAPKPVAKPAAKVAPKVAPAKAPAKPVAKAAAPTKPIAKAPAEKETVVDLDSLLEDT